MNYPLTIGGRDADFSQVGLSLLGELENSFPINEVPIRLKYRVEALISNLKRAENEVKEFIDVVREYDSNFLKD